MNIEKGPGTLGNQDGWIKMVTFQLGRQIFALPIEPIQQIIEMVTITPVPQVNNSIEGVINYHGSLVPVINLRRHLSLPEEPLWLNTPIILVMISGRLVGLIVDEVMDVINRPTGLIFQPIDILPDGMGEVPILKGLTQLQDEMVMLLDLERLFLPQQARALAEAANALSKSLDEASFLESRPEQAQEAELEAVENRRVSGETKRQSSSDKSKDSEGVKGE